MSQEGYDKLVAELRHMESVELPQVRDAIAEARDKGDLSENFEYHAAKREQSRLLGRIRFKQRILEVNDFPIYLHDFNNAISILGCKITTFLSNKEKIT